MGVDRPRLLLATAQDMRRSTLRHLVDGLDGAELDDVMARATRTCEAACGKRLVPFTGLVEIHRAYGATDYGDTVGPGYGVAAVSAAGYSAAVGGGGTVRSIWVDQTPPRFVDLWQYSDITIEVLGGTPATMIAVGTLLGGGIAADTGELQFAAGRGVPVGVSVRVTYSGGYTTIPQDLVQACRLMAAADIGGEDGQYPGGDGLTTHGTPSDPGAYLGRALKLLEPYGATG